MAICGNCGTESRRIRSRWTAEGIRLPDQCPSCARGEFGEKFTVPSDKKLHMGFEAHPNEYEKHYDADGEFFIRKPEYRAEQEERLRQTPEDDRLAQETAEAAKRAHRRIQPMREDEHAQAVRKAELYAEYLKESAQEAERERQEAELQSWIQKAGRPGQA